MLLALLGIGFSFIVWDIFANCCCCADVFDSVFLAGLCLVHLLVLYIDGTPTETTAVFCCLLHVYGETTERPMEGRRKRKRDKTKLPFFVGLYTLA